MPSGARKLLYSSKTAKSRSSVSQPSVQLEPRISPTLRGRSVPMRSMSTFSGVLTLPGETSSFTSYAAAAPHTASTAPTIILAVMRLIVRFLISA